MKTDEAMRQGERGFLGASGVAAASLAILASMITGGLRLAARELRKGLGLGS